MRRFHRYLRRLAAANGLGSDVCWLFFPGMLPESRDKWWGDFKYRAALHEGIDICYYADDTGTVRWFGPEIRVPAFSTGIVRNICKDFLGESIVVEPDRESPPCSRVLMVYAHILPAPGIYPGCRVEKGQVIARVSDTTAQGSPLLPHLHLSCVETRRDTPFDRLDWQLFPLREKVNLINPVFL